MRAQEFLQGMAEGKVKLYTDPSYFGAEVDDTGFDSLAIVDIPANQLVGFEPDDKMNQPKSKANVEKIVAGLKQGAKLPPLLVRKYKNGYQVLDGHHRFWAYKLLGVKSIPSRIVPDEDIEEISKRGVAEGKQPGQPVTDAILKAMPIAQEIWFHGSRATGKHRKNSDTDILVVVPDDLVGDQYLGVVRILQKLSRHFDNYDIQPTKSGTNIHRIAQEEGRLLWSNRQGAVQENFHDGKNPQDRGDSARHGIAKKSSLSSLDKIVHSKTASPRKKQLAHWQANMRRGRAKKS
jgi:predicted nucleotidyltransferase